MKTTYIANKSLDIFYLRPFVKDGVISKKPLPHQDVLLYWSKGPKGVAKAYLNPPQAIGSLGFNGIAQDHLLANKILTPKRSNDDYIRLKAWYRVDIVGVNVVRVAVKRSRVEPTIVLDNYLDKDAQRVCEQAIAALYALDLDFGTVVLGIDAHKRLIVLDVRATPELTARLARQLAGALKEELTQIEEEIAYREGKGQHIQPQALMLGADLEFMLYDKRGGRWLLASDFLPRQGMVGTDARAIYRPKHGYPLAEIRPNPASCPRSLVSNIREALKLGMQYLPYNHVAWIAGSCPMTHYPLGGHIHFTGLRPNRRLLQALDNYLALPLLMIEEPSTAIQRRQKYGTLGDFRFKYHGGFEYRTPASWMVSPQIATATLCLATIIAQEYPLLQSNYLDSLEAKRCFYRCEQPYFKPIVQKVWEDITHTPSYKTYQQDLGPLEKMIDKGQIWQEKVDIRTTWALGNTEALHTKASHGI